MRKTKQACENAKANSHGKASRRDAEIVVRCRLCGEEHPVHRAQARPMPRGCKRCGYPFTEKDFSSYA